MNLTRKKMTENKFLKDGKCEKSSMKESENLICP